MKKFVIINPYDVVLYMTPYSVLFRNNSQIFYKMNSIEYLKTKSIEVISILEFLADINIKYDLTDYNTCQKYYADGMTSQENLLTIFKSVVDNFIQEVTETDTYNNSVVFAVQLMSLDLLYPHFDILDKKNIKIIFFYDNIHFFIAVKNNVSIMDICKTEKSELSKFKFSDPRLDRCSHILSMSKLFNYIGIYTDKMKQFSMPVNDIVFSMYTPINFDSRKKKILLTGTIYGYPMRQIIHDTVKNSANSNYEIANKLYDIMNFVGYDTNSIETSKLDGLYGYYKEISKYQGSYVGSYMAPLDHVPWKAFEVLATGTLLFAHDMDLERFGLIADEHYVLLNEKDLFNESYVNKYLGTAEGKRIATNGYNKVRELHDGRKYLDFFVDLINTAQIPN